MMTAEDMLAVLDALESVGVSVRLDGGWGVDALLARQTRPHDDLDAVIDRRDLARAQSALARLGFQHAAPASEGQAAPVLADTPDARATGPAPRPEARR